MKNQSGASGEQISIIIPTYNESANIKKILNSIKEHAPKNVNTEAIVVDDNSPDGTGRIVEEYIETIKEKTLYTVNVIHRKTKDGLSSAILHGIKHAKGDTIVVMDSDYSHPPSLIPKLVELVRNSKTDIVIASRYLSGGSVEGWSIKRKLISKIATLIAKKGLGIKQSDPMSGFFAFKKNIVNEINFDAIGYKILLEMLVKIKGVTVKEIPYTFTERAEGKSKLDSKTVLEYIHAVWRLYRYGRKENGEKRVSVSFLSKAARFFTVGASGLAVNYLASLLLTFGVTHLWYIHANVIGILISMTSNFVLNKAWTFEDRDFGLKRTISQYGRFVGLSSIGALVQLGLVYYMMEEHSVDYSLALVFAVAVAAFGNFVLNKRLTFKEKVWS